MKITFFGAAQTVTGSMHMVEANGRRILLDCGLFQGRRQETFERNRHLPFDARDVDAVVLSHAHIDHSGNIPNLVSSGFRGRIYCTYATRDLCSAMLLDSGHIQESDVTYVNNKRRRAGQPPVEPVYTVADARASLKHLEGIAYHRTFPVTDGITATFFDAGHILGSAVTVLEIVEAGQKRHLCFSGDLGRRHLPVLRDPEPPPQVDAMIVESTYGTRLHASPEEAAHSLSQAIGHTIERGGKVIIPAFAVGRTQDIVYDLHKLIQNGDLPSLPVYVDSPLAVDVTRMFRLHPECYDQEMRQYVNQQDDPFGFHRLVYVRSVEESKALNQLRTPCIIVSASGMCEGGRILHHLKNNLGDPRNTVLFVGFQAENTLGRKLVEGNKTVPILGEMVHVRAEVSALDGYSAHADHDEILSYVNLVRAAGNLEHAYCVHGDAESCEAMGTAFRQLGVKDVTVPQLGQAVDL